MAVATLLLATLALRLPMQLGPALLPVPLLATLPGALLVLVQMLNGVELLVAWQQQQPQWRSPPLHPLRLPALLPAMGRTHVLEPALVHAALAAALVPGLKLHLLVAKPWPGTQWLPVARLRLLLLLLAPVRERLLPGLLLGPAVELRR